MHNITRNGGCIGSGDHVEEIDRTGSYSVRMRMAGLKSECRQIKTSLAEYKAQSVEVTDLCIPGIKEALKEVERLVHMPTKGLEYVRELWEKLPLYLAGNRWRVIRIRN